MKKLLLLMGIATISYAANGSTNYQSGGKQPTQQSVPQTSVPSDCSHLSEQEQQFATQLSDMHRTMFCRHFSVSQRLRAMTLASPEIQTLTGQNKTITPDEAVEAVMKDARQDQSQSNESGTEQQQGQNPYSNYSYPNNSMKPQSNPYTNQ
ncbi:MAG: hypothetical protein H7A41_08455 [Chlamydiales bacterium]|nr:hypothetical protein [Chlamydiia bacterium]MCP5505167.1 hypothetical protein [Chlamydiales bacterium]